MSTPSDAVRAVESTTSPLTDIPIVGTVIGWIDAALNDFGWPTAVDQVIEFLLLGVVVYFAGRWFLSEAVPWLATVLVGPVNGFVDVLRAIFLIPDLAVARSARLAKARPPTLMYSYGNVVLDTADHMQSAVRKGLPALSVLSRRPGMLTVVAMVLAFTYWNASYCSGHEGRSCESPTAEWVRSAKTMLDEHGDGSKDKKVDGDNAKHR
jgi:hypothetical protein